MTLLMAALATFLFTSVGSIAGVGAAFILVPVFVGLGFEIHTAMATALLLNAVGAAFSSARYARKGLIVWRTAVPILVAASLLAPLGAVMGRGLDREPLLWMFVAFLVFAASMMLFYRPRQREPASGRRLLLLGTAVGGFAGLLGGLLGVGGGNLIVPVLVWLGFEPKKASATTAFVIVFSSLSGFASHVGLGVVDFELLALTVIAAAGAATLGSYLMAERLRGGQVKTILGVVLIAVAAKLASGLLW